MIQRKAEKDNNEQLGLTKKQQDDRVETNRPIIILNVSGINTPIRDCQSKF